LDLNEVVREEEERLRREREEEEARRWVGAPCGDIRSPSIISSHVHVITGRRSSDKNENRRPWMHLLRERRRKSGRRPRSCS
jgi:hypothetical protein